MENKILDVKVDFGYDLESASEKILEFIKNKKSGLISTTNPYFIISAAHDQEFKNIVNNSLLSLPDGVGVLYARYFLEKIKKLNNKSIFFPMTAFFTGLYIGVAGYFDKSFGQTVTGVDLVYKLCELAPREKLNIFLLGGRIRDSRGREIRGGEDMAVQAGEKLKKLYPGLNIVGATSRFSRETKDDKITLEFIHKCMKKRDIDHIDILFVAYNPISQEKWISRNSDKIPAIISIGVGRTYDYITNIMRPPNKMYDKLHIAWLYALIKQPWRIRRIVLTIIDFPLQIFLSVIRK